MDFSGNVLDWTAPAAQNVRKRQRARSPSQGFYGRARLDGQVETPMQPPVPPMFNTKPDAAMPLAFLEFSRRLYNSTLADMDVSNQGAAGGYYQNYDQSYDQSYDQFDDNWNDQSYKGNYQNKASRGGNSSRRGSFGNQSGRGRGGLQKDRGGFNNSSQKGSSRGGRSRGSRGSGSGGSGWGKGAGGNSFGGGRKGGSRDHGGRGGFDMSTLPLTVKIPKFCEFLKQNAAGHVNSISGFENCLSASRLYLSAKYDVKELIRAHSFVRFTASLSLAGRFLVRSLGDNKKHLKHEVYEKAVEILTTMSVKEILLLKDPGTEQLRVKVLTDFPQLETYESKPDSTVPGQSDIVSDVANEGSLNVLLSFMKKSPVSAENCIEVVECSLSKSRCHLRHSFECISRQPSPNKTVFKGSVKVGGVLMAEGHGTSKKDAKHNSYANLLAALTAQSATDLLSGKQIEGRIPDGIWEHETYTHVSSETAKMYKKFNNMAVAKILQEEKNAPQLSQKMSALALTLRGSVCFNSTVNSIDSTSLKLGLSPVLYYSRAVLEDGKKGLQCELYINDMFISSATGSNRKDAQIATYALAYKFLTTSSSRQIMAQPKRDPANMESPNFVGKFVKGSGKLGFGSGDSNLERLKCLKFKVNEVSKSLDDFVILEYVDWANSREKNAFNILNVSASMSGMLLEWTFGERTDGRNECSVTLQKELTVSKTGASRASARVKASAEILNRMYKTHPVVMMPKRRNNSKMYTWKDLHDEAEGWVVPEDFLVDFLVGKLKLEKSEETMNDVLEANKEGEKPDEAMKPELEKSEETMNDVLEANKEGEKPDEARKPEFEKSEETMNDVLEANKKGEKPYEARKPLDVHTIKYGLFLAKKHVAEHIFDCISFGPGIPFWDMKALTRKAIQMQMRVDTLIGPDKTSTVLLYKAQTGAQIVAYLESNGGECSGFSLTAGFPRPHIQVKEDRLWR